MTPEEQEIIDDAMEHVRSLAPSKADPQLAVVNALIEFLLSRKARARQHSREGDTKSGAARSAS